jgi:bifunctional non-homologous end joining protein LigD
VEASLPYWIDPMAPTLTQERFREPGWIFERKFDGIRLLAYNEGTDVRLFSRNRLPQHLPSVASAIARLPSEDLILDGELTWSDGRIEYHLFDILRQDDRDLTGLPWRDRRYRLEALPLGTPLDLVALVDHARPWELARVSGWEGVIAKQIDSPYESKRSRHWMKMKCEVEATWFATRAWRTSRRTEGGRESRLRGEGRYGPRHADAHRAAPSARPPRDPRGPLHSGKRIAAG